MYQVDGLWKYKLNVLLYFQKWYQTLEVAEDCEDETLRLAFVHLAKQYHPDSGTPQASAIKFSEV